MKHEVLEYCSWISCSYGLEEEAGWVEGSIISPPIQFDTPYIP